MLVSREWSLRGGGMCQENGVLEEACRKLNKRIKDPWKDLNATFFDPQSPTMPFLLCVLNCARLPELFYKAEDGFTNSINTKRYLISLFVDPIEII